MTARLRRGTPLPLLVVLAVLLTGLAGVPAPGASAQEVTGGAGAHHLDSPTPLPEPVIDPLPAVWPAAPEVTAPVYLLVDAVTGQVLAEEGADLPRPVASTVKILTALTVLDLMDPDDEVTVGDEVLDVPGASGALLPGDERTVEELLAILMVRSGNDVAEALAVAAAGDRDRFLDAMDATARSLGLGSRTFMSPSGLDDEQLLSARELAQLGAAALAHPDLAPLLALEELDDPRAGTQANRNELIGSYRGATGIKTGFTEAAGNSLVASARRGGRELIAVVLGGGEDPARFVDAEALLDHGFDRFEIVELSAGRDVAVAGGSLSLRTGSVEFTAPQDGEVELALPVPVWPPEDDLSAPLLLDGDTVTHVTAVLRGQPPVPAEGSAAVGRALVNGVYAAMRAGVGAARLTPAAVR